ncbi:hypothetical protein HRG_000665 [Hirsutella rhossiliensis]|uniref:Uncharacterized protein n=1 Tax=Hirsutella rhossiliensis TaxID=111463 RepID=A0A9P8N5I9_9HYPO|nr:uncharacterized protein HRG_00665 [Hirsutella rhossiliensis]KAH0968023.1 hypothetical protein HRG_00665 [Hirsutella rhossiliensis]
MKSAIVLASTAVPVGALPQTKHAAGQKLPWTEGEGLDCHFGGFSESCVGTEIWCNIADYRIKGGFKTAEECFATREAKPGSTEGVCATLKPPKPAPGQTGTPAETPEQKPDFENSEAFRRCNGYIPDNPCIRELFYLQGSVNRFRLNCLSGDLAGDQVHRINLAYYSKDLFPDGPKCGAVQGRLVHLTPKEYKPVCDKCIKPHT